MDYDWERSYGKRLQKLSIIFFRNGKSIIIEDLIFVSKI